VAVGLTTKAPKAPQEIKWKVFSFILIAYVIGIGCTTNEQEDEIVLSFTSIFSSCKPPPVIYDYSQFIVEKMHEQLMRLPTERVFKYSSVLYHMFLYFQVDKFPLTLQKMDTKGQPRSVIFWTPLTHQYSSPYSYNEFIDSFVHPVMTILSGTPPPRISFEIKRVLLLNINH